MKRNIALLLLALLFLMPYSDVNARRRKKYYPVSYFGGYAGVGYSQLMHDIPTTTISGGGAGLLGFEYFVKYGKKDNYLNISNCNTYRHIYYLQFYQSIDLL